MLRIFGVVTVLLTISSIGTARNSGYNEFRFVTVVFRHGDRAPDNNGKELYPNDPYLHNDFFPMGLGGLTNTGKNREYLLGKVLRERYNTFLDSVYIPKDVYARSTDFLRTKMSLSLVLASLYPPTSVQTWNTELNWQPVPFVYEPHALDVLLVPEQCPRYLTELERVKKLPEVVQILEDVQPLMRVLTEYTGRNITTTTDMYYLYHSLKAESLLGLPLPEWTKTLFPDGRLLYGATLEYKIANFNKYLRRLNGGTLLKRITEDMLAKVTNGTRKAEKINIFSGHETNVAALLEVLGVFEPHVPAYSSAVIVELIQLVDQRYYVRVLYYHGIPPILTPMTIPGCIELCPLDDFLELLKDVIPTDEELVCSKPAVP